jgi:diguanylate cyclase (GGDEF)-like protein
MLVISSRIQRWIVNTLAVGGFSRRADVIAFAFTKAVWTTAAAVLLNYGVYKFFEWTNLFHDPTVKNSAVDGIITACVAFPIGFIAYYVVGVAIFDLAISGKEFERLSRTDTLTGLMNRRAFVDTVEELDAPYILVLFDIDRFKSINDTYGHSIGDDVLIAVAQLLASSFGLENPVARLGGEEFGVVLKSKSKDEALEIVNKVREGLAASRFSAGGRDIGVTISAGVSQGEGRFNYSALLSEADKALYLAKASGRNRVVHADEVASKLMRKEAEDRPQPIALKR